MSIIHAFRKLTRLTAMLTREPAYTIIRVLFAIDAKYQLSTYSKVTNRGERIVVQSDWESMKICGNFIELSNLQFHDMVCLEQPMEYYWPIYWQLTYLTYCTPIQE